MPRRNADAGILAPGSAVNNGIEQLVLRLQRVGDSSCGACAPGASGSNAPFDSASLSAIGSLFGKLEAGDGPRALDVIMGVE
jgi:hypothetical protein